MGKNNIMKKGQATVFIIVALVIVALIIGYFVFTKVISPSSGSGKFSEVYDYYDICVENTLSDAVSLAGTQGGRVYTPDFIPGSEYAPFSSQFNFFGFGIPYWMYLSGNGIIKEQVPNRHLLEKDLERYLNEQLSNCDFGSFYEQGYNISLGEVNSKVSVSDSSVSAVVSGKLEVGKDGESAVVSSRNIQVQSMIGSMLDEALKIYSKEKTEAFLENYSVDVLRLNSPVDGTLIQCNPQMWSTDSVKDDLQSALEANIASLKFDGKNGDYFSVGYTSKFGARAIYSSKWPQAVEISGEGAEAGSLIAKPVGNQEGLGILGFCYVPYHFVYDLRFPVMIQMMAGDEIFQFPVVVVVDKNLPRQGIYSSLFDNANSDFDLCSVRTQEVNVNVFDVSLNPVDAEVSYQCFDQECIIGSTKNGVLKSNLPACVGGVLNVRAEGYSEQSESFSSNEQNSADIILDKLYEINVSVKVGGKDLSGQAMISFDGKNGASAILSQSPSVKLSEGYYNVTVMVYGNSSIVIPASSSQQCVDVSSSGFLGLFGGTSQKCFNVDLPETKVEYALQGGGVGDVYFLPSDLEKGKITLNVGELKKPNSLEELQNNYAIFNTQGVEVE